LDKQLWHFQYRVVSPEITVIDVQPPAHLPKGTSDAVFDFIHAEIGGLKGLQVLKPYLTKSEDFSGNGVGVSFHEQNVTFEALYDQWEPVTIPRADYDELIFQLEHFLKSFPRK
jgi:hypothetical protein